MGGINIIAQELLELLVSQIMEHKTLQFDIDDEKLNKESEATEGKKEVPIPFDKVMAVSDAKINLPNNTIEFDLKSPRNDSISSINTRVLLTSKDYQSIMSITTLVPFIKSGIPRLSTYDILEAKK
jgi:hypothetical protein